MSGNVPHVVPTTLLEVRPDGKTFAKVRLAKDPRWFLFIISGSLITGGVI